MPTPKDAPYKLAQKSAKAASRRGRLLYDPLLGGAPSELSTPGVPAARINGRYLPDPFITRSKTTKEQP